MSNTLTVTEVANILRVSSATVIRWADAGVLPSWRLPSGHRRFDAAAVLRFQGELFKPCAEAVKL